MGWGWKPVGWGWKPVGWGWKPVGWDIIGCCAPIKPVGCVLRNDGLGEGWKGELAFEGRVGTKLLKPVVVGTSGCNRLWLTGIGARGPLGPLRL